MTAGLSSFAAEMTAIDSAVRASATDGAGMVAMIDEPARSTNPIEGTALVESLVALLGRRGAALLLTTHYNVSEALNVAESLNISPEWIGEAKKLLKYE